MHTDTSATRERVKSWNRVPEEEVLPARATLNVSLRFNGILLLIQLEAEHLACPIRTPAHKLWQCSVPWHFEMLAFVFGLDRSLLLRTSSG